MPLVCMLEAFDPRSLLAAGAVATVAVLLCRDEQLLNRFSLEHRKDPFWCCNDLLLISCCWGSPRLRSAELEIKATASDAMDP